MSLVCIHGEYRSRCRECAEWEEIPSGDDERNDEFSALCAAAVTAESGGPKMEALPPATMSTWGENLRAAPVRVAHASLERSGDSCFRSFCPVCRRGELLVRDPESFDLIDHDRCTACGQTFIYIDRTIAGESVKVIPVKAVRA